MRLDDSDRVPLIVVTVCETLGGASDDAYRHDKHAGPTRIRHVTWACIWMLTNVSVADIAERFNHSPRSVRDGVARFTKRGNVAMVDHREFLTAMEACEVAINDVEATMTGVVG